MDLFKNTKFHILMVILFVFILLGILIIHYKNKEDSEAIVTEPQPETFTFFDLGVNTVFTKEIKEKLIDKLGPDAIEHWSPVNLETNYKGFLQKNFPRLHELNNELNIDQGVETGRNTIKATYRYARNKKLPFYFIKLVFSSHTKNPLFFIINSKKEGINVLDQIKEKYGKPETIQWDVKNGKSLYWKKNRDLLIASVLPDKFGNPLHHIVIYYVDNIEDFLKKIHKRLQQREEKTKGAAETAF
ncbi:MAG: hypothetical protein JRI32_07360 [Deltaproteobacteria bacterium]|nr:hypothetical protein [Deltaproteobacteria bacterium]MBW2011450.1 hypothetical protein [Deltaproteobacteria bacterium]